MIISTRVIVMMRLMIQLIPIMMIISNTCMSRTNLFIIYHTLLFLKYVELILHIFLSMFCLSVLIGLLFLIAGD